MKRFKNTYVGTSADFAKLSETVSVETVDYLKLKDGIRIPIGRMFVNETSGEVYMLTRNSSFIFWIRIDNIAVGE